MDRRIRIVALFLVLCFLVLFIGLNNLQIAQAHRLLSSQYAPSQAPPSVFSLPRGDIVTADGVVLATSSPSHDSIGEQRSYPQGSLYADITGYYDAVDYAATGVEDQYDNYLQQHQGSSGTLHQLLTQQTGTDSVVLTIRSSLQKVAAQALAGRTGGIIALNPQNGDIYAMYGNPTFNPNDFSSHNGKEVKAAYAKDYTDYAKNYNAPGAPLTNQVTEHTYPPGSTEKVITTAAIYDHDPSLANINWPVIRSTKLPLTTSMLQNFGGEACGGSLIKILTVSCDTAYALVGVQLGADNLVAEAKSFGFDQVPPIDIEAGGSPQAVAGDYPKATDLESSGRADAFAGYSAIGQFNVGQTVLGNALVAAGIADNGTIMTPHVMADIVDDTGKVVESYQPHPWLHATSSTTAQQVRTDMLSVAESGTAKGLFPSSESVAAKTGTAETTGSGAASCTANWLIATAPAGQGQTPTVAVAAVIPAQNGISCGSTETTGASIAGPAVAQLLNATLAATK